MVSGLKLKALLFANTDWYLYNFRLALAIALREAGYEVVCVSPPGRFGERLRAAGFRWIEFPFSRPSQNPFAELITIARLWRLYRAERPSVVHHFTIKCVIYGSLVARLMGIRGVINAITGAGHIFIDSSWKSRMIRPLVRAMYRVALPGSRVIFQNNDDLELFVSNRLLDPDSFSMIRGSGVNVDRFHPVSRPEPNDRVTVLFASRLLWSKGLAEYVAAAAQLRSHVPKARFLMAGEADAGNPAAIPDEILRGWHAQGAIEFLGHVEDMPTLLSETDLVVLPSYREGVPRILTEAAASGLPLVAADAPGSRDIVWDGENGFLVPLRDAHRLAEAISRLISDRELRLRMGARSREIACRTFDEAIVLRETLSIYRALTR